MDSHLQWLAVSLNPQWGRFYETMGSDPDLIYQYAAAFVEGVDQGNNTVYNMKARA